MGPRNKLREKADVQRQQNQFFCTLISPRVQIDDIAQRLKGVKLMPSGSAMLRKGTASCPSRAFQRACRKIKIFKIAQQQQVCRHRGRQHRRAARSFPHAQACAPVQRDGRQHQKNIHRLAPAVKEKAGHQQQPVFCPAPGLWQQIIDACHQRQEKATGTKAN